MLEHIREKHLLLLPIPRKKNLEFVIELAANTYNNYSSMKIVLPIQFTKKTNKAVAMDADTTTVNNFFGHWITGINIQCYPDDTRILQTNNNVDVYQYSNAQLKYPPEKSVKIVLKNLLYSNKPVYLDADTNRRSNTNDNVGERSDPNLTYRLVQLKDHVYKKFFYSIPLGVLVDLGLVNFAENTDTKFLFTLERNMNRLFESNKKVATIPTEPGTLIQFHDRPYISYEEINLTKTFDVYLSGVLRSEQALRMGVLPASYQQLLEINKGTQSITVTFNVTQRQF